MHLTAPPSPARHVRVAAAHGNANGADAAPCRRQIGHRLGLLMDFPEQLADAVYAAAHQSEGVTEEHRPSALRHAAAAEICDELRPGNATIPAPPPPAACAAAATPAMPVVQQACTMPDEPMLGTGRYKFVPIRNNERPAVSQATGANNAAAALSSQLRPTGSAAHHAPAFASGQSYMPTPEQFVRPVSAPTAEAHVVRAAAPVVASSAASSSVPRSISAAADNGDVQQFSGWSYPWSGEVRKALQLFGLSEFRPNQLEAINATLLKRDILVLMPTGGGKSLCYQLSALVEPGITVVVSPLRSLIQDQCVQLLARDIAAMALTGEMSNRDTQLALTELAREGTPTKFVYLTPEKILESRQVQNAIQSLHRRKCIQRIVVDEAHCVSQWGHDFRPHYVRLHELRAMLGNDIPFMALTATATARVREDICRQLKLKNPLIIHQSFNRVRCALCLRARRSRMPTAGLTRACICAVPPSRI